MTRKLPRQDWEGDDFTPGAGGKFVTCMDTATGRMLAWATNGRIDLDGRQIRAAITPPDPNGANFAQMQTVIHKLTGLHLVYREGWTQREVADWLRAGRGLIYIGMYGTLPREYRHQATGDFAHAMFAPRAATTTLRNYDPLNPRIRQRAAQGVANQVIDHHHRFTKTAVANLYREPLGAVVEFKL